MTVIHFEFQASMCISNWVVEKDQITQETSEQAFEQVQPTGRGAFC